jgi:hypothetical protein
MPRVRRLTVCYLILQSLGASGWWVMLLVWPETRRAFVAESSPDAVLLAFSVPDAVLFIGAGLLAALGIARDRQWAKLALATHTGAAAYAGLYCLTLTLLTGGQALLGAILMAPSVVFPAWFLWHYPEGKDHHGTPRP